MSEDGAALARSETRMPDGLPVASRDAPLGGQAVLEGVMMRGVSTWAVAVRNPEGEVEITTEPIVSWAKRHRVLRLPPVLHGQAEAGRYRWPGRALQAARCSQQEQLNLSR